MITVFIRITKRIPDKKLLIQINKKSLRILGKLKVTNIGKTYKIFRAISNNHKTYFIIIFILKHSEYKTIIPYLDFILLHFNYTMQKQNIYCSNKQYFCF